MSIERTKFKTSDGTEVEIVHAPGANPGVVFLGGFCARNLFTKGEFFLDKCQREDRSFTFITWQTPKHGTVSGWRSRLKEVFQAVSIKPQTVIASSFGAWLAALLAKDLAAEGKQDLLKNIVMINPVLDATRIIAGSISKHTLAHIKEDPANFFIFQAPSMSDFFFLRQKHLEDGEKNLVVDGNAATGISVVAFQARQDKIMPISWLEKYIKSSGDQSELFMVEGGHDLNSQEFLDRVWAKATASSPTSSPETPKYRKGPGAAPPA